MVSQVAYEVIGNDVTITMAAEAGQLQLNAFEPIIVHSLHKSISHLEAACRTLTARCVRGITANTEHLRLTVEQSIGLVTALNPHLGYATATAIAQEALATGKGVAELVLEHGLLRRAAHRPPQPAAPGQPEQIAHPRTPKDPHDLSRNCPRPKTNDQQRPAISDHTIPRMPMPPRRRSTPRTRGTTRA